MITTLFEMAVSSPTLAIAALVLRCGPQILDHSADLTSLRMALKGSRPEERADIISALAAWRSR